MAEVNTEDAAVGTLFRHIRFYVTHRVPMRSRFIEQVKTNGGQVVPLEKNADIIIADHARSDPPIGSFSYKWIEDSIRTGELRDKDEYRAGPAVGYSRPPGSIRPTKVGGRNPYTAEDDRILHDWVMEHEKLGEKVLGNEIYKKLEQHNSRHPWQSWRDRWIKYVRSRPPPTIPMRSPSSERQRLVEVGPVEARNTCPVPPADDQPIALQGSTDSEDLENTARPTNIVEPTIENEGLPNGNDVHGQEVVDQSVDTDMDIEGVRRPSENAELAGAKTTPSAPVVQSLCVASPTLWRPDPVRVDPKRLAYLDAIFTDADRKYLHDHAAYILNIPVKNYKRTWLEFARLNPLEGQRHSVDEWVDYFELRILPIYEQKGDVSSEGDDENEAVSTTGDEATTPLASSKTKDALHPVSDGLETPHDESDHDARLGRSDSEIPSRKMTPSNIMSSPSSRLNAQHSTRTLSKRNTPIVETESPRQSKRRKLNVTATNSDGVNIDNLGGGQEAENDLHIVAELQPPLKLADNIDVYESNEIPEGDEENVRYDANGLTTTPRRHVRIRSREALATLPLDFKVTDSPRPSDDSWHEISDLEDQEVMDGASIQLAYEMRSRQESIPVGSKESPPSEMTNEESGEDLTDESVSEIEESGDDLDDESISEVGGAEVARAEVDPIVLTQDAAFERSTSVDASFITRGKKTADNTVQKERFSDFGVANDNDAGIKSHLEKYMRSNDKEAVSNHKNTVGTAKVADFHDKAVEMVGGRKVVEESQSMTSMEEHTDEEDLTDSERSVYSQQHSSMSSPLSGTQNQAEIIVIDDDSEDSAALSDPNGHLSAMLDTKQREEMPRNIPQADTQAILDLESFEADYDIPSPPPEELEVDVLRARPVEFLPATMQARPFNRGRLNQAEAAQVDGSLFIPDEEDDVFVQPTRPRDSSEQSPGYQFHSSPPPIPTSIAKSSKNQTSPLYAQTSPYSTPVTNSPSSTQKFMLRQCGLGSTIEDIYYALFRTSLNTRLGAIVLEDLRQGKGLPQDTPGVWTEAEDGIMQGEDAAAMRRLEIKHGRRRYDDRSVFLKEYEGTL